MRLFCVIVIGLAVQPKYYGWLCKHKMMLVLDQKVNLGEGEEECFP